MCECFSYGHDEYDSAVAKVAGHHPSCPHFKVDKYEFATNLQAEAEVIANRILIKEMPKLKSLYAPKRKTPEMSESVIQPRLFQHLYKKGHKLIVPNFQGFFTGEIDVCSVMKSGLVNEYEIKISRSDFFADAKKENKHTVFEKMSAGVFFEKRSYYSGSGIYQIEFTAPNYFYYVVPTDLVKTEEVPHYAGLIYINPENSFDLRSVKKAVRIHQQPMPTEIRAKAAVALMWRCWNAREKIRQLEVEDGS